MNTLVLGGGGFIGSHLVDGLLNNGFQVRVFDREFSRYHSHNPDVDYCVNTFDNVNALRSALTGVDVVYHMISTTVPTTSSVDPMLDIDGNLITTLNLLRLMNEVGIFRIVFLSSGGTIYGKSSTPLSEKDLPEPICSYGVVKLAIERYLLMYQSLHGFQPVILRVSNPYGPRQISYGRQGVVTTFLNAIKNNKPIEVWGNGSVVRDFVYISDLIELCIMAGCCDVGGVFNVGSGEGCSINNLIETISEVTGRTESPTYEASHPFDVDYNVLDISKVKQYFDWQPKISLHQGIRETWQWMNAL